MRSFIIGMALIPAVSAQIGGDEGWYRVHCNIDGADVYFDGHYQGTTYGGSLDVPVYTTGFALQHNPGREERLPYLHRQPPIESCGRGDGGHT